MRGRFKDGDSARGSRHYTLPNGLMNTGPKDKWDDGEIKGKRRRAFLPNGSVYEGATALKRAGRREFGKNHLFYAMARGTYEGDMGETTGDESPGSGSGDKDMPNGVRLRRVVPQCQPHGNAYAHPPAL